jgi:hypothetical protein
MLIKMGTNKKSFSTEDFDKAIKHAQAIAGCFGPTTVLYVWKLKIFISVPDEFYRKHNYPGTDFVCTFIPKGRD